MTLRTPPSRREQAMNMQRQAEQVAYVCRRGAAATGARAAAGGRVRAIAPMTAVPEPLLEIILRALGLSRPIYCRDPKKRGVPVNFVVTM